jgi:purine nucleosidase
MDIDINQGANYGAAHVWPDRLTPHLGERKVTLIQKVDVERFLNQFVKAAQFDAPGN